VERGNQVGVVRLPTLSERSRAVDSAGLFRCIVQVQKAGAIAALKARIAAALAFAQQAAAAIEIARTPKGRRLPTKCDRSVYHSITG